MEYFNWESPSKNQYYDWEKEKLIEKYGGKVDVKAIPPYKNPDHDKFYGSERRLVSGSGHFKGVIEKCTFYIE